jgi:hypothetical protein
MLQVLLVWFSLHLLFRVVISDNLRYLSQLVKSRVRHNYADMWVHLFAQSNTMQFFFVAKRGRFVLIEAQYIKCIPLLQQGLWKKENYIDRIGVLAATYTIVCSQLRWTPPMRRWRNPPICLTTDSTHWTCRKIQHPIPPVGTLNEHRRLVVVEVDGGRRPALSAS